MVTQESKLARKQDVLPISKPLGRSSALAHLGVCHRLHGASVWLRLTQRSRHLASRCERSPIKTKLGGNTHQRAQHELLLFSCHIMWSSRDDSRLVSNLVTSLIQMTRHPWPWRPTQPLPWLNAAAWFVGSHGSKSCKGERAPATIFTSNNPRSYLLLWSHWGWHAAIKNDSHVPFCSLKIAESHKPFAFALKNVKTPTTAFKVHAARGKTFLSTF